VIAAILAAPKRLDDFASLEPAHFYVSAHSMIFEAMRAVARRGVRIDSVTVAEELDARGRLQAVGGPMAIFAVGANAIAPLANAESHARIVAEKARIRALIDACQQIAGQAHGDYGDAEDFVASAEKQILAVSNGAFAKEDTLLYDEVIAAFGQIQARRDGQEEPDGIPTGFPTLDAVLGGLRPGELTVIGGRPAQGKTTLATQIAINAAASNHAGILRGVWFASLEMTNRQVVRRTLQSLSGVALRAYERRCADEGGAMYESLLSAANRIGQLPIYIDDTTRMKPAWLRAAVRRRQTKFKAERGPKGEMPQELSVVVIDFLQRMGADEKYEQGYREIADAVNSVADTAKELGVHALVLAQLGRDVEKRSGPQMRPRMSDLSGSKEIEAAANNIMFVHRPEFYEAEADAVPDEHKGLAEIIVNKQRDGETALVRLRFNGATTSFHEPSGDDLNRWAGSGASQKPHVASRRYGNSGA